MTIFSLPKGKRRCVKCGCIQDFKLIECNNCGLNLKFVDSVQEITPENLAKRIVSEYLLKTQPVQTQGKFAGTVYLTPPGVYDFPSLGRTTNIVYEHNLNYVGVVGREIMQTFYWERGSQHKGQIRTITYLPILPLEKCIKCQEHATRFDVGEVSIIRESISFSMTGVSQETVDRISTAWGANRYWIPVPFCAAHKMETDATVQVVLDENRQIIKTTSPAYSQEIASFYKIPAQTTSMALRARGCGAPVLGLLGLIFLTINGSTLFEIYSSSGKDLASIFSGEVFMNLTGLVIGLIMAGLSIRWLFVKPLDSTMQPPDIKPDSKNMVEPNPNGTISTSPTAELTKQENVYPADPVENAIKKGLSISSIVVEDVQLVKILENCNDERRIKALISFMNRANNQANSANDLVARQVEISAFKALVQADGDEVIPALKQIYSRQTDVTRQVELINFMAEAQNARSVQLLVEVADNGFLRDQSLNANAYFHNLASIAQKELDLLAPYVKRYNVQKAIEISEINRAFNEIYQSLKSCDLKALQAELDLPDLITPSPCMVLTSISRVENPEGKPVLIECKEILRSPSNVEILYTLLKSTTKGAKELARDLLSCVADETVADHVLMLFTSDSTGQQPFVLSLLTRILPDREKINSISAYLEKTFLNSPTLETALLLAGLNNPLSAEYILLDLQNETQEKFFTSQEDESKAQFEFESHVNTKSSTLIELLQQNGQEITVDLLKKISHIEDPVFTSHYSSIIDGEEYDYIKKKSHNLDILRKVANQELKRRSS